MPAPIEIEIETDEINRLLGTSYSDKIIAKTLENVGFEVKLPKVTAPAWRTDIHIKEDIIEEVGRLLGYDNIEPILPLHSTANRNEMLDLKSKVRDVMSSFGANEVLTYSFVSGRLLEKLGFLATFRTKSSIQFRQSFNILDSRSCRVCLIRRISIKNCLLTNLLYLKLTRLTKNHKL